MRNIARAVLAQLGYYDVDEAADANEAVSRASFANFDLCIFDHAMRSHDGAPLDGALRSAGSTACCIALRAADSPASLDQPLGASVTPAGQSLRKPFAPEALRRCIDAALAAHSGLRAA